ncbi:MAG: endonuclease/exonuclease/phosphatase family protein [Verrucomicrobia bacterium]|nr:endonuclease/exonuclease/phosphatase family protein [Verrucomicrobiota bacterium]
MTKFFRLKVNFEGLLTAAGGLLCLLTLTAFLGRIWWGFDLTTHFRFQYLAGLLLLAIGFAIKRKLTVAGVFSVFAILNGAVVVPYCFTGRAAVPAAGQTLRVLLLNVDTENRRYDLVENLIRECDPDLVVLLEVNHEWMNRLDAVLTRYPHVCQEPREDNFGIALLSKLPLENAEIVELGEAEVPSVTAEFRFADRTLRILGTHPLPPANRENSRLRNQQLEAIPEFLAARGGSVILLGDLNVTPWSPHFQKLLRGTGLKDSARGFGWQTTWPASLYPLRIAIDHCLLSQDLRVVGRSVGSKVGSDHLPLVVELAVD